MLLALIRPGLLRPSLHGPGHPERPTSVITGWLIVILPSPDFHRLDWQPYRLQAKSAENFAPPRIGRRRPEAERGESGRMEGAAGGGGGFLFSGFAGKGSRGQSPLNFSL